MRYADSCTLARVSVDPAAHTAYLAQLRPGRLFPAESQRILSRNIFDSPACSKRVRKSEDSQTGHSLLARNASTSAREGIDSCAPRLVTEMAAAAEAKRAAANGSLPSSSATAKAPLKQSPAATVSIALTRNARTQSIFPFKPATNAPSAPRLSTTPCRPRASNSFADSSGLHSLPR